MITTPQCKRNKECHFIDGHPEPCGTYDGYYLIPRITNIEKIGYAFFAMGIGISLGTVAPPNGVYLGVAMSFTGIILMIYLEYKYGHSKLEIQDKTRYTESERGEN